MQEELDRPNRVRALRTVGMADAVRGLRAYHKKLIAQRQLINAQISAVARALVAMCGSRAGIGTLRRPGRIGRPPRKPYRRGSLKYYILQVLRDGGTMAVKDITAGVLKLGYKTKNKTLNKSVGIALANMANVRKVARGRFRLGRLYDVV